MKIDLEFVDLDSYGHFIIPVGEFFLERRTFHDAFKITFLDYDLSVQHAMVRVPKQPCSSSTHKCPVVLALHGAGVEASNPFWTESYQQRENAWVLYPTGRTSWGFDWHGPSHRNVEYALDALHVFASSYRTDMAVNRNKLVYVGHSNGGQGAWWMASHYPDKALAGTSIHIHNRCIQTHHLSSDACLGIYQTPVLCTVLLPSGRQLRGSNAARYHGLLYR